MWHGTQQGILRGRGDTFGGAVNPLAAARTIQAAKGVSSLANTLQKASNRRSSDLDTVLYEGTLRKRAVGVNGPVKNWRMRYFYLTPTQLMYFADRNSGQVTGRFPLKHTMEVQTVKDLFHQWTFTIFTHSAQLYVEAPTERDREEWMAAIEEAIAALKAAHPVSEYEKERNRLKEADHKDDLLDEDLFNIPAPPPPSSGLTPPMPGRKGFPPLPLLELLDRQLRRRHLARRVHQGRPGHHNRQDRQDRWGYRGRRGHQDHRGHRHHWHHRGRVEISRLLHRQASLLLSPEHFLTQCLDRPDVG